MSFSLCYHRKVQEKNVSDDAPCNSLNSEVDMSNGIDGGCLSVSGAVETGRYQRSQQGSIAHDYCDKENNVVDDDDYDDEEDSDWEPINHFSLKKWFCRNCTMPNFEDVCQCDVWSLLFSCLKVCGEHREADSFGHELFKSTFCDGTLNSIKSEVFQRSQASAFKACTAIGFDDRMLLHAEVVMRSHPHPERPDRLKAIAASLAAAGIFPGRCSLIPAREIYPDELGKVHSFDHIEAVRKSSCQISSYFTPDTYANQHSALAARIAAGLCADLAIFIMSGKTSNGFALVRPPGHHAGTRQAMGFCLHNNAAIAAFAAQAAGAKKVLIVDWDVHHGNGTQEIFEGNKSVLYVSLHRHDNGKFYPGTGGAHEVGVMDGQGYTVNIPWSQGGIGDNDYMFAFQHVVLPVASEFAPDITIVSAGFDAARGDPLGCCDVTPAGYAQMTHLLSSVSGGKLLVILEGGYNLRSISSSATSVVKVLLGENPGYDMSNVKPSKSGLQTVLQVLKIQSKFWPSLHTNFDALRNQWKSVSSNTCNVRKRRKVLIGPIWWRWGTKKFVYELLYGKRQRLRPRRSKRMCL